MISYAQLHEDVLLNRVFGGKTTGLYIDVGAHHPTDFSITKHFYDLGWRGINVEPSDTFRHFPIARPHDVNLNLGLAAAPGEMTLYETDDRLFATFSVENADEHSRNGRPVSAGRRVPVDTLAAVCAAHVGDATIDFLTIDVEGSERDVLAGGDFRRWRPRVVLLEAVRPCSSIPAHEEWEPLLLAADYTFAAKDAFNRYYVRSEESELLPAFVLPVTRYDNFVDFLTERMLTERESRLEAHAAELAAREAQLQQLTEAVARMAAGNQALQRGLESTKAALAAQRERLLLLEGVGPRAAAWIRQGKRILNRVRGRSAA